MTIIRPATSGDLDRLVTLWLALSADGHAADARYELRDDAPATARAFIAAEWINDNEQAVLVAESGEIGLGLVGFVTCRPAPGSRVLRTPVTYAIGDIYVTPSARRTTIGTSMVEAAVAWARAQGAQSLEVGTLANDRRAVTFWTAQGFVDWRVTLSRDV